jgi:hypothetical protein
VSDGETLEVPQAGIGWLRAIGSGLVVLVVAFGATIGVTNWILTNVTSVSRDNRVWLASALFLLVVAVVAWSLRRLQSRGLI